MQSNDVYLTHRVPKKLRDDFNKKFPHNRSKIVRGLIQMLLSGEIKKVTYTEKYSSGQ